MDFTPSPRSVDLLERLRDFDEHVVRPEEATYREERRTSGDIRSTDFLRLTALRGGNGQPRAAQFSVRMGF